MTEIDTTDKTDKTTRNLEQQKIINDINNLDFHTLQDDKSYFEKQIITEYNNYLNAKKQDSSLLFDIADIEFTINGIYEESATNDRILKVRDIISQDDIDKFNKTIASMTKVYLEDFDFTSVNSLPYSETFSDIETEDINNVKEVKISDNMIQLVDDFKQIQSLQDTVIRDTDSITDVFAKCLMNELKKNTKLKTISGKQLTNQEQENLKNIITDCKDIKSNDNISLQDAVGKDMIGYNNIGHNNINEQLKDIEFTVSEEND